MRHTVTVTYCLLIAALTGLASQAGARVKQLRSERHNDRGSVSLEQVVVTVGLFALAVLIVAGVTAATTGRLGNLTK